MKAEKKKRVLVGMSGGVDSSVAALLLKQAGYEVVGVTMLITPEGLGPTARKLACYGEDEAAEIEDVARVASHLGIEFRTVELRQEYEERILNYFRQEYARGRTPNPCVKCNAEIKFGLLLEGCRKLGLDYDYFATGHYARVRYDESRQRQLLLKARDSAKDQSYFLSLLSQEQLSRSLFPLGELTKTEVRRIARSHNLPVSDKQESQDFYAGDYRELLPKGQPGPIKDLSGQVLGWHNGIENYTVGQRRGLGIASHGRLYVIRIESATNTVYIGQEKDLLTSRFFVDRVNWIARVPASGEVIEATAKVRYKSPELICRLIPGPTPVELKPGPETSANKSEVGTGISAKGRSGGRFYASEKVKAWKLEDQIQPAPDRQEPSEAPAQKTQSQKESTNKQGRVGGERKEISGEGRNGTKIEKPDHDEKFKPRASSLSLPDVVEVILLTPYKAITPGQVAVFYDGDEVLGGGFIR